MKSFYFLILGLCLCHFLSAQVFFTESFETTGDYSAGGGGDCSCVIATVDVIDGQNDHFADVRDTDITHNFTSDYTGKSGSRYWASEDNDDDQVGGSGGATQCVTLSVDIAGKSVLQFLGLFGAHAASAPTPYEADNDMEVSYDIDGGGFTKILDWHENAAQSEISLDTNNDGFGDGTFPLSTIMQTVTALMPGSGNTLSIQICTNSNTSSEEFAFDLIQVSETILPVELITFTGNQVNNTILMKWKTASELNNKKFEIEESQDGQRFLKIGEMQGNGNTSTQQDYSFEVKKTRTGVSYYRLKQIDFDGQFEYSKVISVNFKGENRNIGEIYPTPSKSGLVNLDYFSQNHDEIRVSLFDLTGKLVVNQILLISRGNNNLSFDFSDFNAGIYIVKIENEGNLTHRKLIIER